MLASKQRSVKILPRGELNSTVTDWSVQMGCYELSLWHYVCNIYGVQSVRWKESVKYF